MIAHKVIDDLRTGRVHPVPGTTREKDLALAELIERAQKFDFGSLALERNGDRLTPDGKPMWLVPALTPDEREMWRAGYIPAPFPLCWYEFTINNVPSGALVCSLPESTEWVTQRVDYAFGRTMYDQLTCTLDRALPWDRSYAIELTGNAALIAMAKQNPERYDLFIKQGVAGVAMASIYLTLMLNSATTEVRSVAPPPRLVKRQAERGKTPMFAHRVVDIVPVRFRGAERVDAITGERRSPRLHWRRTHIRHYANGKLTVIPRCLVGKAELGEVSHEYRYTFPSKGIEE